MLGVSGEVIAALVTGLIVAAGALRVKHIENKNSVEAQFRDAKVKLFNEFMEYFNQITEKRIQGDESVKTLKEWKRKLLFWGGPKVMVAFLDFLSLAEQQKDIKTIGILARHTQAMGNIILAMREDVGLSNKGIVTGGTKGVPKGTIFGARYIMRHPNLFLDQLRKNPAMTLEQLGALEKGLTK